MSPCNPLDHICRLCGSQAKLLIGVFTPEGEKLTLERKIRMCLPITISAEDEMPKDVCHPCLQMLEIAYTLYLKCNAAQNIIKNMLKFQALNTTPKTCFIEQMEREKVLEKGSKDVRSVELHMPPPTLAIHTQGQPFPPTNPTVESGPSHNRFPLQNGYMVNGPQPPISTAPLPRNPTEPILPVGLSDFCSVGRLRPQNGAEFFPQSSMNAGVDCSSVGQLRSIPPFQALSSLQSVGQIRPVSQVKPVSHVGAVPHLPPNPNLPTEPIDSKENILLNQKAKIAKPVTTEKPTKSVNLKTVKTAAASTSVPTQKQIEKSKSLDSNVAIVPEPMVALSHIQPAGGDSAESATAISVIENPSSIDLDPLGDDNDCDITDITDSSGTPASKRRRNNNDVLVACKYCSKMFSEDFITHHQNLHLRVKFFSCVACDKNFATEVCLYNHKCVT